MSQLNVYWLDLGEAVLLARLHKNQVCTNANYLVKISTVLANLSLRVFSFLTMMLDTLKRRITLL